MNNYLVVFEVRDSADITHTLTARNLGEAELFASKLEDALNENSDMGFIDSHVISVTEF